MSSPKLENQIRGEKLCERCNVADQQALLLTGRAFDIKLGSLAEVFSRTKCPLCRFVSNYALGKSLSKHDQPNMSEVFDSLFQTRQITLYCRKHSRFRGGYREVVPGEPIPKGDVYLQMSVSVERDSLAYWMQFQSELSCHDNVSTSAYYIHPHQFEVAKIKNWIEKCELEHGSEACRSNKAYSSNNFWLIDVFERRLVTPVSNVRYAALSYVWGSSIRNLLDEKSEPSELIKKELPHTIENAIDLVRKLDISFLWVDFLCIDQRNEKYKLVQIQEMDQIYSNAYVTIVAPCNDDASQSIPGVAFGSRTTTQNAEVIANIACFENLAPLRNHVRNSPWATRGWTFQEAFLSPRCLVLTCQRAFICCEDAVQGEGWVESFADYDYWDYKQKLTLPYNDHTSTLSFEAYQSLVTTYSHRNLTYATDSLIAFEGVLSWLEKRFQCRFQSGLPIHLMGRALLWRINLADPFRQRWDDQKMSFQDLQTSHQPRPTWSWAFSRQPVTYDIDGFFSVLGSATHRITNELPLIEYSFLEEQEVQCSTSSTSTSNRGGVNHAAILAFTTLVAPIDWRLRLMEVKLARDYTLRTIDDPAHNAYLQIFPDDKSFSKVDLSHENLHFVLTTNDVRADEDHYFGQGPFITVLVAQLQNDKESHSPAMTLSRVGIATMPIDVFWGFNPVMQPVLLF